MYPHAQPDIAQSEVLSSDKNTGQSKRPFHEKEILGVMQRTLGGGTIIGLTIVTIVLWFLFPILPALGRPVRTDYQRWFTVDRLTGRFVIAGRIHGFLVDPVLQHAPVLLVWYIVVAVIGTAAYVYRELLNPFFRRLWQHNYSVEALNHLDRKTLEVTLAPVAQPVPFVAGQFVFVRFGGGHGWEPHPFTT